MFSAIHCGERSPVQDLNGSVAGNFCPQNTFLEEADFVMYWGRYNKRY